MSDLRAVRPTAGRLEPRRGQSSSRVAAVVPLVAWCAALVVGVVVLTALGRGGLAAPPMRPSGWTAWAESRGPAEAAIAVLRLVALGLAWYLLLATALSVAASLVRARPLSSVADVVALPAVRTFVAAALGMGLVGAALALVNAGGRSGNVPVATADAGLAPAEEAPVLRRLPHEVPPVLRREEVPDPLLAAPAPATPVQVVVPSVPATAAPQMEWQVQPGDHLWSIAERTLASAIGRAPAESEVTPYWRQLVDANADRLGDPSNPDLLFVGQVMRLPPAPGASTGT